MKTLKCLDLSVRPLQWKVVQTEGVAPSERFNHTMLFYEPQALLIIYGGKNSSFQDPNKIEELNQIHILNLETMVWSQTCSFGDVPKIPRANHAATLFGTTMIVFGGLGTKEFVAAQAKVIELSKNFSYTFVNCYLRANHGPKID